MRAGARIDYRIRLHGVPIEWETAITTWEPPERFVDEQRRGPYKRWVHTHRFIEDRGGTEVLDDVEFDVPFRLIAAPLVARDLRKVFAFRHQALQRLFEQPTPWTAPQIVIVHS